MNAIISLCHFCENHGPSIIFCTQVFHSESPLQADAAKLLDTAASITKPEESSCTGDAGGDITSGDDSQPCSLSDKLKACALDTDKLNGTQSIPRSDIKCEACRSLPPGLSAYNSNDTEAGVRYVSSQHPHDQQVFSMVRQACVRSLSSEVSPGRDGPGPIFFGDDTGGYVLSHTFIIKDSQYSRGFQRRYSFIVVMMDKIYLLNSWPFLVRHLRDIIDELQAKAMKVYEAEQAKNPARSQRVAPGTRLSHMCAMKPSKQARSLVELTGDKHIFRKLHQTFTWLLKAGGNRLTERLLEGPPTEDSIIDIEKQEETEEGFVLLSSLKDETDVQTDDDSSIITEDPDLDDDCPVFFNLRHVLKVLGYTKFHKLAHHVVIGNQIIVQGTKRRLIKSAIDCLKTLLPRGCCKVIYYSNKYEDTYRCNFLGISPTTLLPHHIEHYVVMNIHEPYQGEDDPEVEDAVIALHGDELNGYMFTVESPTILPEKGPVILGRMEYALMNENLADSVVDQCLICLKEECMNKVKVLFKFTKAGGSRSDDDTRELLRIVGAQPEDKVVLQYWRTGLSSQYRHHMVSAAISKIK